MSKICSTCKYWERFTDITDIRYHGPYAGNCSSSRFTYSEQDIPADSLAYWDHEGYNPDTIFCTGEAFGCIHWEQKP